MKSYVLNIMRARGGLIKSISLYCFSRLYRLFLRARIASFESLHGSHVFALCPEAGQLYPMRSCRGVDFILRQRLYQQTLVPSEEHVKEKTLSEAVETLVSTHPEKVFAPRMCPLPLVRFI